MTHPAYVPMFQACLKYRLPTAYHADFAVHDHTELENLAQVSTHKPFLWLLRECGTHLFHGDRFDSVPPEVTNLFAYEERHFFVWTGGKLVEFPPDEVHRRYLGALASWKARKEVV